MLSSLDTIYYWYYARDSIIIMLTNNRLSAWIVAPNIITGFVISTRLISLLLILGIIEVIVWLLI